MDVRFQESWKSYEEDEMDLFNRIRQTATEKMCNSEKCKVECCVLEDNLRSAEDFNLLMKGVTRDSVPIKPKGDTLAFQLPGYRYCHIQGYLEDEPDKRVLHRWGAVTYVPRVWDCTYFIEIKLNPYETRRVRRLDTLQKDDYLGIKELDEILWNETKQRASVIFCKSRLDELSKIIADSKKS